jgi:hypothetical protein
MVIMYINMIQETSHDLHVSDSTTSIYQNGIFNMDIKSYNILPEKIKRLH